MKKALGNALGFLFMVIVGIGMGSCLAAAETIEKEIDKHRRHAPTVVNR